MLRKIIVVFLAIILGIVALFLWATDYFQRNRNIPIVSDLKENVEDTPRLTTIAEDLEVPWDLTFLPDKDILVTERKGRIQRVDINSGEKTLVATIEEVLQNNESGLHGIELHPDFEENNYVYLYYTYAQQGGTTLNKVVRYTFENNSLTSPTSIIDKIPGAQIHDGGRIRFGPDNYLYVATGDASEPSLAQNTDSLAGKILRVKDNGDVVPTNPFNNQVYTYGHRNPQGLSWDKNNNLWSNEHGPTARDELNLIKSGNNYGWPQVTGDATHEGITGPIIQSDTDTWAPSGNAYVNDSLFFVGLRSNTLFEAVLDGENVTELKRHLQGEFGRLRGARVGPDGMLYITTSNRDGRGVPSRNDDRIIRINPEKL